MAGLTPHEYENFVADLYREIATRDVAVFNRKRYPGRSGQMHEIDVAIEFVEVGVRFLITIERKYWRSRVSAEEVMVVVQRVADIGGNQGVLITTLGSSAVPCRSQTPITSCCFGRTLRRNHSYRWLERR